MIMLRKCSVVFNYSCLVSLRLDQHVSEHQNFCLDLTWLERNVKESMK